MTVVNKEIVSGGKLFLTIVILITGVILFSTVSKTFGQLSVNAVATPYVIDFDNSVAGVNNGQYNGTGFTPTPTAGQINSNAFALTGLSDGNLAFGDTQTTPATDFTRGESAVAVGAGGMWAFTVATGNRTFGFQPLAPGNTDMNPGTITLRIQNNSGVDVLSMLVDYDIWVYNDQPRSSSFNVSYSTDGSAFTSISSLNYNTTAAADALPTWQTIPRSFSIDLSGSPVYNGNYFYIRWSTADVAGLGVRDQLALNDITVTANPPNDTDTDVVDSGYQPEPSAISSLSTTSNDAVEVFYFTIADQATSDFLPTKVKSIRIVPGSNNNINWATQIGGALIYDGVNYFTIQSLNINNAYIDLNFASDVLSISNGGNLTLALLIYLMPSGITDGGLLEFQIDTNSIGFSTYGGGSAFAPSFPSTIASEIHTIDVTATKLGFQTQPVSANTFQTMPIDVSVEATDANGNRDLDYVTNISLSSTGSMTGEPISVAPVDGLATWTQGGNPLVHTVGGTGLTLTASTAGLTDAVSSGFDITQTADRVSFTSYPSLGQTNQVVQPIIVSALKPDLTVDITYNGQITLSKNSGPGTISGTLSINAVNGVAIFNNISFNSTGDYTLLATGAPYMTTEISGVITIQPYYQDFTSCPPVNWTNVLISGNGWTCGSGYESVSGIGATVPTEAWLISPSFNFGTFTSPVLSFDTWTGGTDTSHPRLQVYYSTNYTSGNPNLATWLPLEYSPSVENSQSWALSGLIDLSAIGTTARIAFKYTSSGTTAGSATEWRIDNVSVAETGCLAPTSQVANLTFSNPLQNALTLNWNNGNGTGRIVIAREETAVTEVPVNGTNYTANAVYGTAGTEIGSSFVVYKGYGNSATVTGLNPATVYHFAIFEYNCNSSSPTFNITNPAIGNRMTIDPNASDIIVDPAFVYPQNIAYASYQAPELTMIPSNSLRVLALTIRDGGVTANADLLNTTLTAISFSTDSSTAIRAAAIYKDGVFVDKVSVNGSKNSIDFDLSTNPLVVSDTDTLHFELYVTFMAGDFIIDNEQLVFSVASATADPGGTLFYLPDAGGATSINTGGNENTIRVIANDLRFVEVPTFSVPIDEEFTIEVEARDALNSRDRDKNLRIFRLSGTGILSSASGLTKPTTDSTALWTDLIYNTEETNVRFRVTDDGTPTALNATTQNLNAKPRITIYTFTGATGSEITYPADKQPIDGSVSDISRGANIIPVTRANTFNARSWPLTGSGIDLGGSYYEFTVSANPGYLFNISSIEFDHRRSNTGPIDWQIRNSSDGYTSNIGGAIAGSGTWNRNENVVLSLNGQSSVTFRIYAFNATNGNGNWALDNIEIFGNVYDSQAPSFTATYPQYDSIAVNGFDLIVNTDEATTAYYVVQTQGTPPPNLIQVINGLDGNNVAAAKADTIGVTSSATNFRERVSGLASQTLYDVYYVLYDSTNYSLVVAQTSVPTADTTTVITTATPPAPSTISSSVDTPAEAIQVYSLSISDAGTQDGAPTHVTRIKLVPGANNNVDWLAAIGGFLIYNDTESAIVPTTGTSIYPDSVLISFAIGSLTIANGTSEQLTFSLWLGNTGGIDDNSILEFETGGAPHGNRTYFIGSQFPSTFTPVTSNQLSVDVVADRLNIITYTNSITDNDQNISLSVEAVDINGNVDQDEISDVIIVLGQNIQGGSISTDSPPPTLTQALVGGLAAWTNIRYDTNDDFITLIATNATLLDDTTGIIEVGNPDDLIVTTTLTLSSNLTVNNVDIQSTGDLTINSGVTLSVAGDFNIDGILNGTSGTVEFIAGGTALQTITSTINPVEFYNITIQDNSHGGVLSEVNINLNNTLTLAADATFDADGTANNRIFTLRSTPNYTARIAAMGVDARLDGNITWQRSLRTGPQGWRYIGVPVKGQSLANLRDDVFIQGIVQSYSTSNSNITTYSEPSGTTGANGSDGWVPFTTETEALNVGIGMKLYLWTYDYTTYGEQVLDNTGLVTIGDGTDNIAGADETYNFPLSFTPTSLDGGGWNFLANPYPSELDWTSAGFTRTNIAGDAIYIWNPTLQQYGTYSGLGSINGVTQYIASGQAFFVKAAIAGASLTASELAKSSGNGNSFLRVADEPLAKLNLKITSDKNNIDETVITFMPEATDDFDVAFDAKKLAGGRVNLSSKLNDEQLMAINVMGAARGVQVVNVDVNPLYYGKYTFTFPELSNFEEQSILTLHDKFLNKSVTARAGSKYDFTAVQNNPSTFRDRFELHLVTPVRLNMQDMEVKAGHEFVIPVTADQFADIMNSTLSLEWDTQAVNWVGVDNQGDAGFVFDQSKTGEGKLVVTNAASTPLDYPDGTSLFGIRFKAINGISETAIRFNSSKTAIRAIEDIAMPVKTRDGLVRILQNRNINGIVATSNGALINGAVVKAQNPDETLENISKTDGGYLLDAFEKSNYTVSATRQDASKLTDVVTTLDIIKTRRHILQIEEIGNPYQVIAADVNGSESITALDLAEMRRVVLGLDQSFRSGLNWLIIPETNDLSNDPFSYNTSASVSLTDLDLTLDMVGVKVGDVDNSWSPTNNNRRLKESILFSMDQIALTDDLIEIPVIATNSNNLSGYQFSISWNPNEFELAGIDKGLIDGFYNQENIQNGVLTTMWDEESGKSMEVPKGGILFILKFKASSESSVGTIDINSSVTEAVAFDDRLNAMGVEGIPANLNMEELRNGELQLLQNVPNPFDYSTDISFKTVEAGKVTLTIVNMLGETLYIHEANYKPGYHHLQWNKQQSTRQITPGVYLYRIECNGQSAVKKMMIR